MAEQNRIENDPTLMGTSRLRREEERDVERDERSNDRDEVIGRADDEDEDMDPDSAEADVDRDDVDRDDL